MGICYIIGAGDFGSGEVSAGKEDYIIAGDGGYRLCKERGIQPDLVVGDFDSLGYRPDHPNIRSFRPEKDVTDMHIAVKEGLALDYRRFVIFGGTGGRLSHTIANIQLLSELAEKDFQAVLMGVNSRIFVIHNSRLSFEKEENGYVSVFSLSDRSAGVSLRGLKYSLEDAALTRVFPLGVSNEFQGQRSEIEVKDGTLLIITELKNI